MAEDFVRKDVFDARMDRMEALLEKTLLEVKAENEKLRSELNTAISGMRNDLNTAVSSMKADNEKLRSEVNTAINGMRNELNTAISGMRNDLNIAVSDIRESNTKLNGKIEALTQRVDQNFAFVNMRIDSVQTSVYWVFAALSILIGFIAFLPAIGDFLKNLRKPSVTIDEVRAEVRAILNETLKQNSTLQKG